MDPRLTTNLKRQRCVYGSSTCQIVEFENPPGTREPALVSGRSTSSEARESDKAPAIDRGSVPFYNYLIAAIRV